MKPFKPFKPFKIAFNEIKILLQDRLMRLSLFAVVIIPLLYGALYLWAFWDPYKKIDNLPVAVVNKDLGSIKDAKSYNFGNKITDKLKEQQTLKWNFVSQEEADNGLENKKYYMELVIPENFSKNILSVDGDNPQPGIIQFKAREASSTIAYQITDRVSSEISEEIGHDVSKEYFHNIYVEIRDTADEIKKAADGANDLKSGLTEIKDGSKELFDGSNDAYNGATDLLAGIKKIFNGDNKLDRGINVALKGSKELATGIEQADDGSLNIANGANQLKEGISNVETGTEALITNTKSITENLNTVQMLLADPSGSTNVNGPFHGISNIEAANYIISQILATANSQETKTQLTQLQEGLESLSAGATSLSTGTIDLRNALNSQLKPGANTLVSGLEDLSSGSSNLNNGIEDARDGVIELRDGLSNLKNGAYDLNSGIQDAKDGATELSDKLYDGAKKIADFSTEDKENKSTQIMSNPVKISDDSVDTVPNYGTGFAPYFIPLALWVGALILFQIIKINKTSFKEKARKTQIIFAKHINCLKMATIQALVLDTVLILVLHLNPKHLVLFYLFTILFAWCAVSILQFFVSLLGDIGKFIGIILLMLQLTSASGTYPIETTPKFFQIINPFLPMTYGVSGLREIISAGNTHIIILSTIVLVSISTFFLALTLILNKYIYLNKNEI